MKEKKDKESFLIRLESEIFDELDDKVNSLRKIKGRSYSKNKFIKEAIIEKLKRESSGKNEKYNEYSK